MPSGIYVRTEETKLKIGLIRLGKHHTEAAKLKMSRGHLGTIFTEEHKKKIKKALTGLKRTDGTKEKIRLSKLGNKHPNWKGGRTKDIKGYIIILMPEHPFADHANYVREHRLIMEKFLGRYLTKEEIVHHINEIITDNRIENLRLFANSKEHGKYHRNQQLLERFV